MSLPSPWLGCQTLLGGVTRKSLMALTPSSHTSPSLFTRSFRAMGEGGAEWTGEGISLTQAGGPGERVDSISSAQSSTWVGAGRGVVVEGGRLGGIGGEGRQQFLMVLRLLPIMDT